MTRRAFLTHLMEAGAAIGLSANAEAEQTQSAFVDVGPLGAFRRGTVTRVILPMAFHQEVAYVSAQENHALIAYSARCTHKGCVVDWDSRQDRFLCPCHGGQFDRTGKNLAGPPPAPLRRLTTHRHHGRLLIEAPPPPDSSGD